MKTKEPKEDWVEGAINMIRFQCDMIFSKGIQGKQDHYKCKNIIEEIISDLLEKERDKWQNTIQLYMQEAVKNERAELIDWAKTHWYENNYTVVSVKLGDLLDYLNK